jgi:hypothetical protein
MHLPAQIIERETAVRGAGIDYANHISNLDAAVHRVKLGGEMAWRR